MGLMEITLNITACGPLPILTVTVRTFWTLCSDDNTGGFELLYSCGHVMLSCDAVNNPKLLHLQLKLSKTLNLIYHHKCLPFISVSPCNAQWTPTLQNVLHITSQLIIWAAQIQCTYIHITWKVESLRNKPCNSKGEVARVHEFLEAFAFKNLKTWTLNAFKCWLHRNETCFRVKRLRNSSVEVENKLKSTEFVFSLNLTLVKAG